MSDIEYYRQVSDECEVFETCFKARLPLLIKGPTGCGKSQFVSHMAQKLGKKLIKIACNEDTSATDLLGRYLIQKSDTVWQDGPVTRAVREGAILYLDEIAEAREDVIVALHSITDHRRELYLDRTNEQIKAHSDFMCIASFNPGYQSGIKELKPSTRQRFVTLEFKYPSLDVESEIVQAVSGVEKKIADKLCRLAMVVREQPELGLMETVSTRLLVHAAGLIKLGSHPRRASEIAIAYSLTDDDKSTQALVDLIAINL